MPTIGRRNATANGGSHGVDFLVIVQVLEEHVHPIRNRVGVIFVQIHLSAKNIDCAIGGVRGRRKSEAFERNVLLLRPCVGLHVQHFHVVESARERLRFGAVVVVFAPDHVHLLVQLDQREVSPGASQFSHLLPDVVGDIVPLHTPEGPVRAVNSEPPNHVSIPIQDYGVYVPPRHVQRRSIRRHDRPAPRHGSLRGVKDVHF
mmetsp:Transcript_34531/g.67951  ORF Transcript_34531/g.67951 Transcript_34531/m.67951 type:complete len:203 (-) Transcript_34531:893-1501(-)